MLRAYSAIPIQTGGPAEQQRVNDAANTAFAALLKNPEANALVVPGVVFPGAGGVIVVKHSLNRFLIGWTLLSVRGGYPQVFETARTKNTLTLQSLNACTADVKVW